MIGTYTPFPAELVAELDELTYRRHRHQTNHSVSFTSSDDQRIREIVMALWKFAKPRAGDIVAGAELREVLGKGSFGTVWKSYHAETQSWRAVKIFDSDRLGDGLAVHLFRRGVTAMLHLREELEQRQSPIDPDISEGIVRIREVEENRLAFAMDLIPGHDLSYGYSHGLSLEKKLGLFRRIAKSVHFAHTRREAIVHRDIKPQNIVMNGDVPVLTDFDIADMASARTLSRRAVGGALAYAAPEQLLEETQRLEFRSDIYSLGRLLHFLLLEQEPPLLIEKIPVLSDLSIYPEGLVKIVRKCTHRELQPRYASVQELLDDLDQYKQSDKVGAYGPAPLTAQKHWEAANQKARLSSFQEAIHSGEQALLYLDAGQSAQHEDWSKHLLWWKFRSGSYHLALPLLRQWLYRLRMLWLTLALLLVVAMFAKQSSKAITSQRDTTFEAKLVQLLQDRSPKQSEFYTAISYFQSTQEREKQAQKRLFKLLLQLQGRQVCQVLRGLYFLSPITSNLRIGNNSIKYRALFPQWLKRLPRGRRSIRSLQCPPQTQLNGLAWSYIEMTQASLVQADFSYTRMKRVYWKSSDLRRSSFKMASVERSQLGHNNFKFARMDLVSLIGSDLSGSNLFGASLRFADLRNTLLDYVLFTLADLRDAKLAGARFSNNSLTGTLLRASTARQLKSDVPYWKTGVCFSQYFYEPSLADQCHQWHLKHSYLLKNLMVHRWTQHNYPAGSSPTPKSKPPPGCPYHLRGPILTFPPGQLEREGQCPWHQEPPATQPSPSSSTQAVRRPTSQRSSKPSSGPSKPR
ncbi:MAG: hypothetical protein EP343_28825 [Deltaproteobacteria bacterium]|nr:MAG: hypothetical protein EP343_28825 [Deltaproteobacteria bacterium]